MISIDAFISPTQLPHATLSIAITDAIGSSKSHCYMMPLFRDLIEAYIKRKEKIPQASAEAASARGGGRLIGGLRVVLEG